MKKIFCMIALGAISIGSVFAAVPVNTTNQIQQTDTSKKSNKPKPNLPPPRAKQDTIKIKRL